MATTFGYSLWWEVYEILNLNCKSHQRAMFESV